MKKVVFVTAILTHYRVPFHKRVRELLADDGVDYTVAYGQPKASEAAKGDTAHLEWGLPLRNTYLKVKNTELTWQPALKAVFNSDLAIIGQENKLLLNYLLQPLPRALRPKLALWGHGRNFQSGNANSPAERWKAFWSTRCDWWFGYTEATRAQVEGLGFASERITVFNNAVDTSQIRAYANASTPEARENLRRDLGLQGDNIAVFVGGLYGEKRLDFLIDSAERIRAAIPDFELIVIGSGIGFPALQAKAQTRPWLKVTGAKFGQEKADLMRLGKVFLMPGLVGLAILDAGIMGLPLITTDYPFHSPEIAYLKDGETGLISTPWQDADTYAQTVIHLLRDPARLKAMSEAATALAARYTIDAMATNFAGGVLKALETK